jgi:hypothetical protein
MVLRSQLDTFDPCLPKQTFDLKTRATFAIRNDLDRYKENQWYTITKQKGLYESFEREHIDMIRSAYLKYTLQARIGNMDGIFIAYHNTREMLGFEYKSIADMEKYTHGNTLTGEFCFSFSIQLLDIVLDRIISKFPKQDMEILISKPALNSAYLIVQPNDSLVYPLILKLTTYSIVNSTHLKNPIVDSEKDKWEIFYELNELNYDAQLVRKLQTSHHDLYERKKRNSGFSKKLKDLVLEARNKG